MIWVQSADMLSALESALLTEFTSYKLIGKCDMNKQNNHTRERPAIKNRKSSNLLEMVVLLFLDLVICHLLALAILQLRCRPKNHKSCTASFNTQRITLKTKTVNI